MLEIKSFNPEFGYELISVIPYAYFKHLQGEKIRVITGVDMKPFYYFADEVIWDKTQRHWDNVKKMNTPNRDIHKPKLDLAQFAAPPYRSIYGGTYDYDVVICNRYNVEWFGVKEINRPVNYFSCEFLIQLFERLKDKKIAYFNIDRCDNNYIDNASPLRLNDYELVSKFINVTHIKDIYSTSNYSFNETQLRVMVGAKLFITMNGGYGIMASFFGGKNIIYTNPINVDGKVYPRENQTGDFGYYHLFGSSEIINVNSYSKLLEIV